MKINFHKDGRVTHPSSGEDLGFWRKEADPVYAEGRFRVWRPGETPEEGMTCYPRYRGVLHFQDQIEEIEARKSEHTDFDI